MVENISNVSMRVILSTRKKEKLFERVRAFCEINNLDFRVLQDEPYWKIEDHVEISIEFISCPIWNYAKWSEMYKYLFEQEFTIEWEQNEDICLCYYPAADDLESYFVIFYIPSQYFFPKPSKSIEH